MTAFKASLAAVAVLAALCGGPAEANGRAGPTRASGDFGAAYAAGPTPWLAEAGRWIGSGKFTALPGPWCADAISVWLVASGRPPLASRMAASALSYGPRLAGPQVGALAVMRTRRGWAGHVGFVDGDLACAPIRLGKPGVEALMSVGRGDGARAGREEVAIAEGMALALIVAGIVWAIRLYDRIWRRW